MLATVLHFTILLCTNKKIKKLSICERIVAMKYMYLHLVCTRVYRSHGMCEFNVITVFNPSVEEFILSFLEL